MKVLFCTSEAFPFIASGGLGDVSYSLPKVLNKEKIDCRVVLPLYSDIHDKFKNQMKYITNFFVPLSWRNQYCGVFELKYNGVVYYFLDNEYYFKRRGIYGHFDDAERFAFFSRAILEMLPHIGFKVDILHSNDWQTALVPVYHNFFYLWKSFYCNMKNVFTIHNIQYQGQFNNFVIHDIIGLNSSDDYIIKYNGCANFLKGAVETADKIVAVSPTYSKEILNPWFAYGLDSVLRKNEWKTVGILNGIDTDVYDPENDHSIYENYSENDFFKKTINKQKLLKRLKFKNTDWPLIGMVTRFTEDKGIDLVMDSVDRIMEKDNVNFVVLGSGDKKYENFFDYCQAKYNGRFSSCRGFVPELSHKIYAAADIFLMPSKIEPCGLSQMIALKYGTIPIVREIGGLYDTVRDSGDGFGNGFTFKTYNPFDMARAVHRAVLGYHDKTGWDILIKRAMRCDNSWKNSAKEYVTLFLKLAN